VLLVLLCQLQSCSVLQCYRMCCQVLLLPSYWSAQCQLQRSLQEQPSCFLRLHCCWALLLHLLLLALIGQQGLAPTMTPSPQVHCQQAEQQLQGLLLWLLLRLLVPLQLEAPLLLQAPVAAAVLTQS
jgi:hypothetical protein